MSPYKYTQKGAFAQAELHTRFMDLKCPDKGNVHEFLDELRVEKEKLIVSPLRTKIIAPLSSPPSQISSPTSHLVLLLMQGCMLQWVPLILIS
jgi:hypothetical protein